MKRFRYPSTVVIVLLGLTLSINSFAQPSNNECSAAITLTSNTSCITTAGTNVNATWNPTTFPGTTNGCGATDKFDVWYKFVAQSPSETITISSAPSQIRLQLLSGTCGSFTSIACGNTSIAATGLTVGNTYYIRVYTQNSNTNTFNICVTHAPPANDNCAGAVSLTSNTSCINTAATLNLSTANGATPLGCFAGGTYYDVWFSFVAVTATQTITISNLGANLTNPQMQLYGGTCAGLVNLTACGTTSVTGSGLTVGATYYVRVANFGSNPSGIGTVADFNICVTHIPPANDVCAGAISLTSGASCVNTAGTLAGASYTTIASIGCGVTNRNDVWYSFVAQATNPTITISSALANPRIQLFSGSCGSLASVACGTSLLTASGLTIGNTYFVRIYTDPNSTGTFNICITDPVPPANDDCTGAVALTSGSNCINTAGTLANATYTSIAAIGCGVANRNDVWYSFVAQTTNPTITISSAFANPRIQLFSGTCASLTSVACGTSSLTASGLTIGNTYFIRIYTDPNASGVFNICVTDAIPPVNDNCAGAVALTSGTNCSYTGGTLTYATYTAIGAIGCGVINRNDVWYSFVAQTTNPTITITSVLANPRIQLFSGGCGALASLACGTTSLTTPNLTIGNTYLVRVYTDPNVTGTFNICVTDPSPPANDNCAGAISLTSGLTCSNTTGTLNVSTATTGLPVGCEAPGTYYDVWYRFVAVSATETITISSLGASITSSAIQLYSGICGALTSLQCGTTTITTPGTLIVGTTYYVRVSNVGSNPSGTGTVANFNICVTHTGAVNDDCSGTIMLTSGYTCVNTAGTTVGASYTATGLTDCSTYNNNDVWYSFVAQSTGPTIYIESTSGNNRIQVQIYSGACGGLSCLDGTTGNSTTKNLPTSSLTIGQTYYVRVTTSTSSTTTFNLCITDPTPPVPPANNDCSGAVTLTSGTTCTNTPGTLVNATYTTITSIGCGVASRNDVWYNFVAQSTNPTIALTTALANPQIQIFSGGCGALVSVACSAGATLIASGLTIGNVYFVRIYTDPNVSGTFNICITDPVPPPPPPTPPVNDDCSGVTILSAISTTCTNTAGTLLGAAISSPSIASTCGTPGADVWYSFVAQSPFPTISLSSIGASMSAATSYIQLFSGSCGAFTSIACVSGTAATLSLLPGGTGLTIGNTYYVRIYSPTTNPTTGTWTYNICITNPGATSTANIDYSKSYINLTKLSGGGGVEPGDVLEIRATFVVLGGTVDSVAYFDTLTSNKGYTFLSGTIATQTNEGKVYKSFTDAGGDDAGWYGVNGLDTTIQINIGNGPNSANGASSGVVASASRRGTITFLDRPRFYGNATIIMATYRVQVYAGYNQRINWGGGAFTYRDRSTGNMKLLSFKNDSLVVYADPGLCSTSLSSNNQVGIEANGTFGTPTNPAPSLKNRGVSSAVSSYSYFNFTTTTPSNEPQDYHYGITNNTSGNALGYTTINTWPKADGSSPSHRIHGVWDIIGDHTGAVNSAKGNQPCDTTQPVSATNPCGYMLVVNAAYKTDTAFKSTITNLCPNTYYEVSAWVRNVCYKCGCDSTGKGSGTLGYVPFALNDTSGVPPNLAFQLNGQDYYQTGNIYYTGTGPGITQQASDTVNAWVKRGFVYKTGPSETGFELLIRNNAPGGGGNDWALDDIVVATCSPEVTVTPGPNPFVCDTNTVDVGAIIASYYDNYTYYKWEKSTNNGVTWTSTGVSGSISPTWNGSAWAYNVSYPTFVAYAVDSGSKYRVLIASTASNLSASSCSFSGGATVTLDVNPCDFLLNVGILSFKGRNENNQGVLYWTTSKEEEPVKYEIQKSKGAGSFVTIGEIVGYKDPSAETNRYTYIDPELLDNTVSWYRIKEIKTQSNKSKYSKVVQLIGDKAGLQIESLINPFNSHVKFDLISGDDGLVQVDILDQYQHKLKSVSYNLVKGRNRINIDNTDKLPAGFYILRVISDNNVINRKIIKRG